MRSLLGVAAAIVAVGCTVHHAKSALWSDPSRPPPPSSRFVTAEDSGLSLVGLLTLSEPDHYAVLLARAAELNNCGRLNHVQLDFFTDHWLIVAFPIARITAICEPVTASPPAPPAPPAPSTNTAPTTPG